MFWWLVLCVKRTAYYLGNTWIAGNTFAKSLQSCPTLCDPIDGSPPGSPVPGILQARTLEWVAISFSSAWKWKWSRLVVSDSSDPIDCSLPGSSIHGIFQARVLEWGAIAFSGNTLFLGMSVRVFLEETSIWFRRLREETPLIRPLGHKWNKKGNKGWIHSLCSWAGTFFFSCSQTSELLVFKSSGWD